MIENLVNEIAAELSVPLSDIQVLDGRKLGFNGSYLLKMTMNGTVASTILHRDRLSDSNDGASSERTMHEIRNALCRLRTLLEK